MRFVGGEELRATLSLEVAVDALEAAFAAGLPNAPLRTQLPAGSGELLVMPASGPLGTGVKLVTVNPANRARALPLIHGVYVLFDHETLQPVALIDGAALTTLRTAAVSALATRWLARRDAAHLVLFGAGEQARAHLEAMMAVRPVRRVTIVSRSHVPAEALAAQARAAGAAATVGEPDAVAKADIVCTCTTSDRPVFDGGSLARGCHVNGIGSHRPDARELDELVMERAALVVVETREAALAEAGDLVMPLRSGRLTASGLHELSEVVTGRAGRRSEDDLTVFKSVGIAPEDLVVARAAYDRLGG